MSVIGALRQRQQPWMPWASAVLLIALLNLAIQPCVMAAPEGFGPQTGHAPSDHAPEAHETHEAHAGHSLCPHCAVFDRGDCDEGDGCDGPDWQQPGQPNLTKDSASSVLASIPTAELRLARSADAMLSHPDTLGAPPPVGPPLTVRYCVYQI